MSIVTTPKAPAENHAPEAILQAIEGSPRTATRWLRPNVVELIIVAIDACLVIGSGLACAIGYHVVTRSALGRIEVYVAASVLVALNYGLLTASQRGYEFKNITNLRRQTRRTLTAWTVVFAALLAIAFTMKLSSDFSRATIISFYFVGLIALLIFKAISAKLISGALRAGSFVNSRAVVIASPGLLNSSTAIRDLTNHGYRFLHFMELDEVELSSRRLSDRISRQLDTLIAFTRDNQIEQVFLLMNWASQQAIETLLDKLKILPIPVHLVPDVNVARFLACPLVETGETVTVEIRRAPLSWKERSLKRLLDIIGALLALLIFSPVMLLTAVLVRCSSPGPILFLQTRNGFNGQGFRIFKFRSMNVLEDGASIVQARRGDPRVTPIGKWLRKTSIDELPQLFNVLKGDMSLVGPRPHAAAHNSEYEQLIGNYAFRHHVKPGITGWAQVKGYRGETRALALMERRVELDLWYINNWSLSLDFVILLRTFFVAFGKPSAY